VSKNILGSSTNTAKKTPVKITLLTVFLSLSLSLIVAEWVLSYQKRMIISSDHMDPGMIQYDKQLGWKLKPHWSGNHHHYDYDVSYTINKDGFRGLTAVPNKAFYSIVGDSFTFGLGVNDDETFVSLLNNDNSSSGSSGPHKSFINHSVPGYSTDQQLLLIKKLNATKSNGRTMLGKHVVLVLYLANDIFDNMRAYPLQADHGKPYFKLIEHKLVLENTPVPMTAKSAAARKETISDIVLGKDSRNGAKASWLSQLELSRRLGLFQSGSFQNSFVLSNEEMQTRFAESLKLLSALITEINKEANKNNGTLDIALLPGRSYVELPASLSAQYQDFFRQHIITASTEQASRIKVIDLATHLRNLQESGVTGLYHANEGHLTRLGHQHVAEYLSAKLSTQVPARVLQTNK
jgi:lysophospholipase L1-like esterase